jgi:hypothetical protein
MIRRRATAAEPDRRQYPPEALALFREYAAIRADYAPATCDGGRQCWVRDGPPSISGHGNGNTRGTRCLGCGGSPRSPIARTPR